MPQITEDELDEKARDTASRLLSLTTRSWLPRFHSDPDPTFEQYAPLIGGHGRIECGSCGRPIREHRVSEFCWLSRREDKEEQRESERTRRSVGKLIVVSAPERMGL